MSTPVASTPPQRKRVHQRTPTDQLAQQMQHMIDLQYETNQYIEEESASPPSSMKPSLTRTPFPSMRTTPGSTGAFSAVESSATIDSKLPDEAVGQGTIYFAPNIIKDTPTLPPRAPVSPQIIPPPSLSTATTATMTTTSGGASSELTTSRMHAAPVVQDHSMELRSRMALSSYGATDDDDVEVPLHPADDHTPYMPVMQHDFSYGHHAPPPPPSHHEAAPAFVRRPNVLQRLLQHEALHRSFCYGAIDGMITGSGIVSTFCGMGLITSNSSSQVHALVLVFSFAACFADSVCMAIGHVWTTHVMADAAAKERKVARKQFLSSKADAKGQLVDLLLQKGMLKIDAMSLADTLEGYPDLFVSALTGESLIGGEVTPPDQGTPLFAQHRPGFSFGRLTDYEMDPDLLQVHNSVAESKQESLVMLFGFTLFAILPATIFNLVNGMTPSPSSSSAHQESSSSEMQDTDEIHSPTLVITIAACIMWVLGVWKSRFMDSNWMLFGIETVVLLLVCIGSAFGLGYVLKQAFLPDYVLDVVTSHH